MWVDKQCNFVETEGDLTMFAFCCEVYANINQQFASKKVKWSHSKENLSDFAFGKHSIYMKQARRLEVQVQDIHKGKWPFLPWLVLSLCSPKLTWCESVLMDCHTQSFIPASGQNRLVRFLTMDLK